MEKEKILKESKNNQTANDKGVVSSSLLAKINDILAEKKELSFKEFLRALLVGYIAGFLTCLVWTIG